MGYQFFTLDGELLGEFELPPEPYFTGIVVRVGEWKAWYKNGILHNEDGHAVEYFWGEKEYRIKGKVVKASFKEFKLLIDLYKLKGLL